MAPVHHGTIAPLHRGDSLAMGTLCGIVPLEQVVVWRVLCATDCPTDKLFACQLFMRVVQFKFCQPVSQPMGFEFQILPSPPLEILHSPLEIVRSKLEATRPLQAYNRSHNNQHCLDRPSH